MWGFIKSTFLFYIFIYSIVSVFSLLICLEDIDHFKVTCPRLGHHIKQDLLDLFKPFRPQIFDDLLAQLLQVNEVYLSLLVFSGILVLVLQFLYMFQELISYFVMTKTPPFVQYILRAILRTLALVALALWVAVYFSGIGLNKFIEITGKLYDSPDTYPIYLERINAFYEDKRQEVMEYFD